MASTKKEATLLRKIKSLTKPKLPDLATDHPYRKIADFFASAGEVGTAQLVVPAVRKIWNYASKRKSARALAVQVFGFPSLESPSAQIVLSSGVGAKRIREIHKTHPEIPQSYLAYFEHFGEIIPLHKVEKQTLLFGLSKGVWEPPLGVVNVRRYMERAFWAAEEEEFPGSPAVLLGYNDEGDLWFGVEKNQCVWTFDRAIQGVRNANYYDDDAVESIAWPEYVLRILQSWSKLEG